MQYALTGCHPVPKRKVYDLLANPPDGTQSKRDPVCGTTVLATNKNKGMWDQINIRPQDH